MYKSTRNVDNLNKRIFQGIGGYDIPEIQPVSDMPKCEFIGFNKANREMDRKNKGVHFFLDDYQFIRVWNKVDAYTSMLSDYACVMTPDFSTYTNYPKAIQIYNHFKKHWLGAYWQENGIIVIPTISWSTPDSYEWCFDGEPIGGIVAVSSVGCMKNEEAREFFLKGYNEMCKRLHPKKNNILWGNTRGMQRQYYKD